MVVVVVGRGAVAMLDVVGVVVTGGLVVDVVLAGGNVTTGETGGRGPMIVGLDRARADWPTCEAATPEAAIPRAITITTRIVLAIRSRGRPWCPSSPMVLRAEAGRRPLLARASRRR
jgi:hypothetical protein